MSNKRIYKKRAVFNRTGHVRITDEVIAQIAYMAVKDIEGVAAINDKIQENLTKMLSLKGKTKGINVTFLEDESVSIDIHVVIKYGYILPAVAKNMQAASETAVKSMTGLAVNSVNIIVTSVLFE